MWQCPGCGWTKNRDGSSYCFNCGGKLPPTHASATVTQSGQRPTVLPPPSPPSAGVTTVGGRKRRPWPLFVALAIVAVFAFAAHRAWTRRGAIAPEASDGTITITRVEVTRLNGRVWIVDFSARNDTATVQNLSPIDLRFDDASTVGLAPIFGVSGNYVPYASGAFEREGVRDPSEPGYDDWSLFRSFANAGNFARVEVSGFGTYAGRLRFDAYRSTSFSDPPTGKPIALVATHNGSKLIAPVKF